MVRYDGNSVLLVCVLQFFGVDGAMVNAVSLISIKSVLSVQWLGSWFGLYSMGTLFRFNLPKLFHIDAAGALFPSVQPNAYKIWTYLSPGIFGVATVGLSECILRN